MVYFKVRHILHIIASIIDIAGNIIVIDIMIIWCYCDIIMIYRVYYMAVEKFRTSKRSCNIDDDDDDELHSRVDVFSWR